MANKLYPLSERDVISLIAIKAGTITDIVETEGVEDDVKTRHVNVLAAEITSLNEILADYVVHTAETPDEA